MKIIKTEINKPPRIVIYGSHGVGKSTFGASCPRPIFIQTESGLDALGVQAFELADSIVAVDNSLNYLLETNHEYKTLVIDSLDWLEKLIFAKVCQVKGVEDIAAIPFGRGYQMAEHEWKLLLDKIDRLNREKKMLILLLAHANIKRFEDPERESYDRYQLDLQNKAAALVAEYSDIVGFASYKIGTSTKTEGFGSVTKARSSGERLLYLEERPAFTAKNRYQLPPSIEFSWAALASLLKERKKKGGDLTAVVEDKVKEKLEAVNGK